MAEFVFVHGINHDHQGEQQIAEHWLPALHDGLQRVGCPQPVGSLSVEVAFYGHIFRASGGKVKPQDLDEIEKNLLQRYWRRASEVDSEVRSPDEDSKGVFEDSAKAAVIALSKSWFFEKLNQYQLLRFLVHAPIAYINNRDDIRSRVQEAVAPVFARQPRVVIAHSLGSVVAYEMLAHPESDYCADTLLTLGSPLGIPTFIFDRLVPAPQQHKGVFPRVRRWVNIAASTDFVALQPTLQEYFGNDKQQVEDMYVDNGLKNSHSVTHYLSDAITGAVLAEHFTP